MIGRTRTPVGPCWLAAALGAAAAGCADDGHEVVGDDVAVQAATVTCQPRGDATLLGVSPRGELWLATAAGTRILDLAGGDRTVAADLRDATLVQPWDDARASVIAADALWSWHQGARELVSTPAEVGAVRGLCSDPAGAHGAFLATDRGVFERVGASWWQWSVGGQPLPPARRLLAVDGACARRDDTLWFASDAGALWRLSPTAAQAAPDGDEVSELAAAPDGVAARASGRLRLGPAWRDVAFASGEVAAISGSAERLWVAAGDQVFVRTADGWRRVDDLPAAPVTAIAAHPAGGAWLISDTELCHAAVAPAVVIGGLRPFERRLERLADLELGVPGQPDQQATIERDGDPVATAAVAAGVATVPELALGGVGWHALVVRTASSERHLDYYVVPSATRSWATDIAPLFQLYCAGGPCHGPAPGGGRPDLSTYDGWRGIAPLIKARLIARTMPPIEPRPDPAELDVILEWIEGGTQP